MSTNFQTSRRQALKFLSAPLMLPVGGVAATLGLGACATITGCGGGSDAPVNFASAAFSPMSAPSLAAPAAMATTSVSSTLDVTLSTGAVQSFKLAYQSFFLTGDAVPDGKGGSILAGSYVDINNRPIIDTTVVGKERQFFSDSPDGTSLLSVPNASTTGIKGKPVFAVVQFEYTTWAQDGKTDMYGKLPSPIAVLTLDQDQTTGKLSLVKYSNVDTSSAHGLWITCGSSLSPWGTHLSSEEYEPDAFTIATNAQFKAFSKNLFGNETTANPYHYGFLPEVTVNTDGTGTIKKHYCLGRLSHELIQVMPDQRTALMGDDATNGGFFMFIADREADLSSGTLYVAKVGAGFSIDPAAAGAPLTWIKLGSASSAEISKLADTLKPADIMDVATTDPKDATYTKIWFNGTQQWIRIKPGMDKAAAFLETHRYASYVGGSMAFTKMEGTTVNIKDKLCYSALQNMQSSMVKGNAANNPDYGVAIDKALNAGGILAHSMTGGQKDTAGAAINSEWVPASTRTLIVGEDIAADALGNLANPDKIGAPDNLKFSEKLRTLFVGEDSSYHVNNFLWAYNVDTKKLSRLASMPAGAEATGLGVVDDLNGWTYITSNFQHPGDWNATLHAKVQATLDPLVRANYKDRFGAVPAVGFGTYRLNGNIGVETIARALSNGYRLLDSAVNYENEGAVGKAVRLSGVPRADVRVSSKLPGRHHHYDEAITTIEESLLRAQLEYYDFYLIHWPNPKQGLYAEAWQALIDARARGLIRSIGVCNFLPEHIEALRTSTGVVPSINQIELHPFFPQLAQRRFDAEHGVMTQGWSPLGRANDLLKDPLLQGIATRLGRTIAQVILRWHIELGVVPLPKATADARQRENLAVFDFSLSIQDMEAIRSLARADGRIAGQDPATYEEF